MSHTYPATLHKQERICSKSSSMPSSREPKPIDVGFPLRVVYMPLDEEHNGNSASEQEDGNMPNTQRPKAKMLISVPKRYFKRAVKRNRVKRQVREAYRKNKASSPTRPWRSHSSGPTHSCTTASRWKEGRQPAHKGQGETREDRRWQPSRHNPRGITRLNGLTATSPQAPQPHGKDLHTPHPRVDDATGHHNRGEQDPNAPKGKRTYGKNPKTLSRAVALLMVMPIRFYQMFITPYTPPACRFTPTCSEYARQALMKHGPIKDSSLRCGASADATHGEGADTTPCPTASPSRT